MEKYMWGIRQDRTPWGRWKVHIRDAHILNRPLYLSMRKHGVENFKFSVIFCSKDGHYTLNVMENHFINEYHSHVSEGAGYNLTTGGQSNVGWIPSEETRRTWSTQRKGIRFHTPETRACISTAQKQRYDERPELKEQLKQRAIKLGTRPPRPTAETHKRSADTRRGKSYHTEDRKRVLSEATNNPTHPFNRDGVMDKRRQTWKENGRGVGAANGNAVFCNIFDPEGALVGSGFLKDICDKCTFPFAKFLAASRHGNPLIRGEWKGWRIERLIR